MNFPSYVTVHVGQVLGRDLLIRRACRTPIRSFSTMMLYPDAPDAAVRFLKFVNASPTPFHAVSNAGIRLEKAGFQKVNGPYHLHCAIHFPDHLSSLGNMTTGKGISRQAGNTISLGDPSSESRINH